MTVQTTIRETSPEVPAQSLEQARALRGLRLYEERGHEIEAIAPDVYRVPSQDGRRSYRVVYGELEACECPDHQCRGVACVHLYAVGVSRAKRRRRGCSTCCAGVVYVGHMVEDPDTGEEVEAFEAAACRRCRTA